MPSATNNYNPSSSSILNMEDTRLYLDLYIKYSHNICLPESFGLELGCEVDFIQLLLNMRT